MKWKIFWNCVQALLSFWFAYRIIVEFWHVDPMLSAVAAWACLITGLRDAGIAIDEFIGEDIGE